MSYFFVCSYVSVVLYSSIVSTMCFIAYITKLNSAFIQYDSPQYAYLFEEAEEGGAKKKQNLSLF